MATIKNWESEGKKMEKERRKNKNILWQEHSKKKIKWFAVAKSHKSGSTLSYHDLANVRLLGFLSFFDLIMPQ